MQEMKKENLQGTEQYDTTVITREELLQMCEYAADKAITRHEKAAAKQADMRNRGLLHNVKILLENYTRFKEFIANSVVSLREVGQCKDDGIDDEALQIFGLKREGVKINSLEKSLATMTVLMAHIDRMLAVYKESCLGSPSCVIQRRWKVIEMMYLRDKRLSTNQIAEELHVDPRNIREDAKMAREDLKVLFFGIEALIVSLT